MQLKPEASAGTVLSPLSPLVLCAMCSAITREIMNVFFRSFGKTCCQDVCAAAPGSLNDTARWAVRSSGSDRCLGHRMSKCLVTF